MSGMSLAALFTTGKILYLFVALAKDYALLYKFFQIDIRNISLLD